MNLRMLSCYIICFAGYLIADEFPAELAAGAAYVAGQDAEGRPVLVKLFRSKLYFSFNFHKLITVYEISCCFAVT
jgi:hypothetical protein